MTLPRAAALAVLAATALASTAAAAPHVIVARPGGATVAGVSMPRAHTLEALTAKWGPARLNREAYENCTADFARLGLHVELANLGGADPCTPRGGLVQWISTRGAWRTDKGLRVGDPEARVRARHPRAFARSGGFFVGGDRTWHLAPSPEPCGPGCDNANASVMRSVAQVVVKNGRVRAFVIVIGAAGD